MELGESSHREQPRAMYPWELEALLQKYKHPQWASIGVESTIYGNTPREKAGLAPHGTVWTARAGVYYSNGQWLADRYTPREWHLVVPKNQIPYLTIKDAVFDEEQTRWKGVLLRGWRPLLEQLLVAGVLRYAPELSFLTGKDSRLLCQPVIL